MAGSLVASTIASNLRAGSVPVVQTLSKPSARAKAIERSDRPTRWTSTPSARREQGDEQADRARTEHEQPVAGRQRRRAHGAQRIAAGLDEGAEHRVDRVGQPMERGHGTGEPFRQGTGPAVPDADLEPVRTDVLPAPEAALAMAAAEHRVADDAAPHPRSRDARPDGRPPAAPLVPDAHGIVGLAGVEIAHRAGEELRVGATHPGSFDLDDHLVRGRHGRLHVLDGRLSRSGDDERAHRPMVAELGRARGRPGISPKLACVR